jgi:hypothetical protein
MIINGKTYEPKDAVLVEEFSPTEYAIVFRDVSILWNHNGNLNYSPNGRYYITRKGLKNIEGAGSACDFVKELTVEGNLTEFKEKCQGR